MNTSWPTLTKAVYSCDKCRLCQTRTNVVLGEGDLHAPLMFIGEGPGQQEDLSGRPFVGPAGQLLDKMLAAIGLTREQVYICNIVKCRPPSNRVPEPDERAACMGYLREQVALVRPKIIVCLGRIAAQKLISPDFRVTSQHGQFIEKGGILFMGTFHPSALLRNPANKPHALSDFQALRDKIKELSL